MIGTSQKLTIQAGWPYIRGPYKRARLYYYYFYSTWRKQMSEQLTNIALCLLNPVAVNFPGEGFNFCILGVGFSYCKPRVGIQFLWTWGGIQFPWTWGVIQFRQTCAACKNVVESQQRFAKIASQCKFAENWILIQFIESCHGSWEIESHPSFAGIEFQPRNQISAR